ncbi:unnamed protein product [Bemisia tabaci]|uniref:Uncharacterized protein n=1 Tax=Bemisia tabaci TaxID=7038 RepID=A0A9P0A2D7_BEMTA|nr:PREDICTED: uncharacterized protein LOC109042752 [Bemisia tabaci]CAH0384309.1 unnamed protein product [Bemisia tabaci]
MMTKLTLGGALLICLVAVCSAAPAPRPQHGKEGAFLTNEAIRQVQSTHLIPQGAQIQKVQEGVEIAAYESIPGDQRINLVDILGDHVPPEVVNNLQSQIDQVGKAR